MSHRNNLGEVTLIRNRRAKIVATLGPASNNPTTLQRLFVAGADVFRLNFSHGQHADHAKTHGLVRDLEKTLGRTSCILMDVQGPKLRLGTFKDGKVDLEKGQSFALVLDKIDGDSTQATLPHPEIFAAVKAGERLLLDDGKVRLRIQSVSADRIDTTVEAGTRLSDRKGVNVPDAVLGLSALTEKDKRDLDFGLNLGVDWVALSFVQKPEDVIEARKIIGDRALICIKMEKPSAIEHLDELVALADGMMVARGDLGVELPPEHVPGAQQRIIAACREAGKPVIVATQMLESMITSPVPTRAEASDVANAIYEGADAVMLSAESAAGDYPIEAVTVMNKIIVETETSEFYAEKTDEYASETLATGSDAISAAAATVSRALGTRLIACHTRSGRTALRASRERPDGHILVITPEQSVARRYQLSWGLHCIATDGLTDMPSFVNRAAQISRLEGYVDPGETFVVTAGVPFGEVGRTNTLRLIEAA